MTEASHYRLERTTIIDHAGTTSESVYITVSRDRLIEAMRGALRSGNFVEESVDFAWDETITGGRNAVAQLFHPSLSVFDGGVETQLELVPDMHLAEDGL
jgi:hypothetical protein